MPNDINTIATLTHNITLLAYSAGLAISQHQSTLRLSPAETTSRELLYAPLYYIKEVRTHLRNTINTTTDPELRSTLLNIYEQITTLLNTNKIKLAQ